MIHHINPINIVKDIEKIYCFQVLRYEGNINIKNNLVY